MKGDKKADSFAPMVKEAEAAVEAVKDPELRRVAFEKILAALLEGGTASTAKVGSVRKRRSKSGQGRSEAGHNGTKGKKGPKAYVEELIDDGYFEKPKTIAEVKAELANRGHHIALTSLSGPLQSLTQDRKLRRQKTAAKKKGEKTTYAYSNW